MAVDLLPRPTGYCFCGCGERPTRKRRFCSGHDATLVSGIQNLLDAAIRIGDVEEAHRHITALVILGYWFKGSSTWSRGKVALARAGFPLDKGYAEVGTQIELSSRRFMRAYLGVD